MLIRHPRVPGIRATYPVLTLRQYNCPFTTPTPSWRDHRYPLVPTRAIMRLWRDHLTQHWHVERPPCPRGTSTSDTPMGSGLTFFQLLRASERPTITRSVTCSRPPEPAYNRLAKWLIQGTGHDSRHTSITIRPTRSLTPPALLSNAQPRRHKPRFRARVSVD